ncbi:deoxyuridine 5'-triphosphate nucleotidohydrolase [Gigaspora rosea]|uniref:Deoxyuridine 5'-triphosphate nucleotidohydrolase n=1 Tax=Gigaspora rosea TaxID=44941 RepID=A0A397VNV2_9GLOM|nr:deoxyuridine 5'-triphosphate nucleotidohydrolase [Gigaspora rosea]
MPNTEVLEVSENQAVLESKKRKLSVSITPQADSSKLLVKRLSEKAKLPVRGSSLAAGYDLYSAVEMVVPAKGKALVPTEISIALPEGTYGRVAPRSSLALNHFLDCGAGVIDADYRGPVSVLLFNFNDNDYTVKEGERIAQLILERIYTPEVVETDSLGSTDRGSKGYGSTGQF